MTEEEAKTKWCPFVRAVTGTVYADGRSSHNNAQPPYNRIVDGPKWAFPRGANCIASACMAWRSIPDPTLGWHSEERERHRERNGPFVPGGYCGLAGAPQ